MLSLDLYSQCVLAILEAIIMVQVLDDAVYHWVQAHLQQPAVQYAFRDVTSLGGDTLAVLFTLFVTGALWLSGARKSSICFLGTMIATAALIVLLKLLIGRPCPLQPDPFQHHWDFPTSSFQVHLPCMPSGHTAGSTVLYSLSMLYARSTYPRYQPWRRWYTGWLLALPVVIGASRVVLSAHWLTDVVAGYALGWGIVWASWKLRR
jgi:undecaprenyl-diphosphatase